jgi:hypothetical protein
MARRARPSQLIHVFGRHAPDTARVTWNDRVTEVRAEGSQGRSRVRPMIRLFAVLAVVGGGLELGFHVAYSGHRRAVHRTIESLRKGMPRAEAEKILKQEESHFFVVQRSSDGSLRWARAGLTASWGIRVRYSQEGELESVRVFTENGPFQPAGVPPDIQ